MSQRLRAPLRQWARQLSQARSMSTTSTLSSAFQQELASSSSSTPFAGSSSASNARRTQDMLVPLAGAFPAPDAPSGSRGIEPTPDDALLANLARLIMRDGKLARAHSHLEEMLSTIHLTVSSPPLPVLVRALEIASPSIRIVGRRKGTKSLPTPQPLTEKQRTRQAWQWIVEASDKRLSAEKTFGKRLAQEVLAVVGGQSEAIKKKEARV
ncbi:hypothetical protein OIO90_003079 [Microbotryomycetes sp. JL221]|nr:hypothetical protein OIO90_003079 [Microbotryomycetes sp. JL221]